MDWPLRKYSRRGFAGILLGALCRLSGQTTASSSGSAPPGPVTSPGVRKTSRTYRCDAVVLFLGLTIAKRTGVGGGQAYVDETGEGASLMRTFFFAGGSDPKRAHGFNRLGWMREVAPGSTPTPAEASYFGVLTSSPEESLENARTTAAAPPAGRSIFSAVSGRNTPGHSRSAITHFEFAAAALWSDRALIEHAQGTFQANAEWRETAWPAWPDQAPPTFLFQLATLLKQRSGRASGRYVYNEQEYALEVEPQPGRTRERLLLVRGKIRNLRTKHDTLFRLWLEEGSDSVVPVRIEYQARSFLRLTFEAV